MNNKKVSVTVDIQAKSDLASKVAEQRQQVQGLQRDVGQAQTAVVALGQAAQALSSMELSLGKSAGFREQLEARKALLRQYEQLAKEGHAAEGFVPADKLQKRLSDEHHPQSSLGKTFAKRANVEQIAGELKLPIAAPLVEQQQPEKGKLVVQAPEVIVEQPEKVQQHAPTVDAPQAAQPGKITVEAPEVEVKQAGPIAQPAPEVHADDSKPAAVNVPPPTVDVAQAGTITQAAPNVRTGQPEPGKVTVEAPEVEIKQPGRVTQPAPEVVSEPPKPSGKRTLADVVEDRFKAVADDPNVMPPKEPPTVKASEAFDATVGEWMRRDSNVKPYDPSYKPTDQYKEAGYQSPRVLRAVADAKEQLADRFGEEGDLRGGLELRIDLTNKLAAAEARVAQERARAEQSRSGKAYHADALREQVAAAQEEALKEAMHDRAKAEAVGDRMSSPEGQARHVQIVETQYEARSTRALAEADQSAVERTTIGGDRHMEALRMERFKFQEDRQRQASLGIAASVASQQVLATPEGRGSHTEVVQKGFEDRAERARARREEVLIERKEIGGREHVTAIKEEIALRKEMERSAKLERRIGMTADQGAVIAGLRTMQERFEGIGSTATRAFAVGAASATAMVRAASPDTFNTLTGSVGLLAGEMGIALIPQVKAVSGFLQDAYFYVRDLDAGLKGNLATIAGWSLGGAGAIMVAGRLIPVLVGLGTAARGVGTAFGFLGRHPLAMALGSIAAVALSSSQGMELLGAASRGVQGAIGTAAEAMSNVDGQTLALTTGISLAAGALPALASRFGLVGAASNSMTAIMSRSSGVILQKAAAAGTGAGALARLGSAAGAAGQAMLGFAVGNPVLLGIAATAVAVGALTNGFGLLGSAARESMTQMQQAVSVRATAEQLGRGGAVTRNMVLGLNSREGGVAPVFREDQAAELRRIAAIEDPARRASAQRAFLHNAELFARGNLQEAMSQNRPELFNRVSEILDQRMTGTPEQQHRARYLRIFGAITENNMPEHAREEARARANRIMGFGHANAPQTPEARNQAAQVISGVSQIDLLSTRVAALAQLRFQDVRELFFGRNAEEARRRELLASVNFQPRQVAVEGLHDMIQQDALRGPLEQERFEQQMRALEALVTRSGEQNALTELMLDALRRQQFGAMP